MNKLKKLKLEKDPTSSWAHALNRPEVFIGGRTLLLNEDLRIISQNLESNIVLTKIEFPATQISEKGLQFLCNALPKNKTLTSLHLLGTEVGDIEISYLSEALEKNSSLTELSFGGNKKIFSSLAAKRFGKVLENNTTLKTLKIRNSLEGNARDLLESLQKNKSITSLQFSTNDRQNQSVGHIFYDFFQKNTNLKSFSLWDVKMDFENFKLFCEGLEENKGLKSLTLNRILCGDTEKFYIFQKVIENNKSITFLDLEGNEIDDSLLFSLLPSFQKNKILNKLHFPSNDFSSKIFEFLTLSDMNLVELNLAGTDIGQIKTPFFKNFLKKNSLRHLDLHRTRIPFNEDFLNDLADFLTETSTVTFLDLTPLFENRGLEICERNFLTFIEKISNNWILKELRIGCEILDYSPLLEQCFLNYEKKKIRLKNEILNNILCCRNFQRHSFLSKDQLPLDLFKFILKLSDLLK